MILAKDEQTYQFKALTDLWTGSVKLEEENGQLKEMTVPDRLITIGLLGSIRWWFEVLVRGLGGGACDPSDTRCVDRNHCVVCELFGCTGWARKFRLEVKEQNGQARTTQIKKGKDDDSFSLRFTQMRPIRAEEWTLLDATLHLIAEYGAIGGKTVFKPTDETDRADKRWHKDYGLVQMTTPTQFDRIGRGDLSTYVSASRWRKVADGDFAWASLQHFWCVNGKYLGRQSNNNSTFNRVIGRNETKNQGQQLANGNDRIAAWLAGSQQMSKKIFSFKNPPRTFGFIEPGLIDFPKMKQRLQKAWSDLQNDKFLEGPAVLEALLRKEDRP